MSSVVTSNEATKSKIPCKQRAEHTKKITWALTRILCNLLQYATEIYMIMYCVSLCASFSRYIKHLLVCFLMLILHSSFLLTST